MSWVNTTAAGLRLGVRDRRTVIRLIEKGLIRARQPGRYRQVCTDSIEAYLRRVTNAQVKP